MILQFDYSVLPSHSSLIFWWSIIVLKRRWIFTFEGLKL